MSIENDPDFIEWRKAVETELIPKLESSSAVVSLVPEGETDIKFAVELGLSIMMDKPIVAVIQPGSQVPAKLVKVADHIIEGDLTTDGGRQRLMEKVSALMEEMDHGGDDRE